MKLEECYEVLGIESSATEAQVKTAYKKLALRTHPDKNPNDPDAAQRFRRVSEAYKRITDPDSFKEDDEEANFEDMFNEMEMFQVFMAEMMGPMMGMHMPGMGMDGSYLRGGGEDIFAMLAQMEMMGMDMDIIDDMFDEEEDEDDDDDEEYFDPYRGVERGGKTRVGAGKARGGGNTRSSGSSWKGRGRNHRSQPDMASMFGDDVMGGLPGLSEMAMGMPPGMAAMMEEEEMIGDMMTMMASMGMGNIPGMESGRRGGRKGEKERSYKSYTHDDDDDDDDDDLWSDSDSESDIDSDNARGVLEAMLYGEHVDDDFTGRRDVDHGSAGDRNRNKGSESYRGTGEKAKTAWQADSEEEKLSKKAAKNKKKRERAKARKMGAKSSSSNISNPVSIQSKSDTLSSSESSLQQLKIGDKVKLYGKLVGEVVYIGSVDYAKGDFVGTISM